MKHLPTLPSLTPSRLCSSILFLFASITLAAANTDTVILDETGVKNLRIETALVEETDFEETFFALGHIAAIPAHTASVSSRIPGRISALNVSPGDLVSAGQEVAKIESRQPGNPPPTIPLTAPISGLITEMDTHLGDPVTQDTSLMHITDLSKVYAVAKIPEHQVSNMKPGSTAHIKIAALPDVKFDGKFIRFGTTADEESGTLDAIFSLENPDLLLREEMRAEFSIVISQRPAVLSVPREALQGDAASRFVYVKHFDLPNAFIKTPVITGEISDTQAEIISGLFPLDEVVTNGAYSLSFAGASSISLKEALDAAHGHEHAADGSELTGNEKSATHDDHAHGEEHTHTTSPLWKYSAILLALLLIASVVGNKLQSHSES